MASALQHRGQEAPASPRRTAWRFDSQSMGYVADAFSEDAGKAARPRGSGASDVHAGGSRVDNAQPILIDCTHGQIAIGHNGNLVNAIELKDELVKQGSIFQTTTDTEVILHLYARSNAGSPDQAIVDAISRAQGAFSLVLMTRDRLIAVRDPHGFRPLALGRLGEAVIVCSETCALDLIGATYVRDVEPGEILIVSASVSDRSSLSRRLRPRNYLRASISRPDSYVFGEASARCEPIWAASLPASGLSRPTSWFRCRTPEYARR